MAFLIYIISFLEGFTTLSIEIIAIRNFTPIIGTNSISTSIILGIILLALSYGYYIGGKNSKSKDETFLINKIIFNLSIASFYYLFFTFAFDYITITTLIEKTGSYFWSILISSFILFFIPVFLASQTIPLLSEILKGDNTGEKMGKLLFFSTIGSFLGSLLTSIFLFSTIGVEKSATLNSIILSSLAFILSIKLIKNLRFLYIFNLILLIFSIFFILSPINLNENIIFKKANSYHNIIIYNNEDNTRKIFTQNSGFSSGIETGTKKSFFKYIIEIKEQIIQEKYENIAIIGAAGFTLPNELSEYKFIKNIDVVDVDSELKYISEKYFLEKKLSEKINFINFPSRYFLNKTIKENKKYDAIVIDIYVGNSLAPQTLTLEFFNLLTQVSDNIYINMITDKKLQSDFSINLMSTIKKSFGQVYYRDVNQYEIKNTKTNFVITNKDITGYIEYNGIENTNLYLDDKNTIELDLFKNN
ncbi:MAG: fused MFS/spermidine synthase [Candidatus Gracilibacteria bacterium]|nr:fused MFS/spermidine synthase [Candidatus Gracilibacteria bacterium]